MLLSRLAANPDRGCCGVAAATAAFTMAAAASGKGWCRACSPAPHVTPMPCALESAMGALWHAFVTVPPRQLSDPQASPLSDTMYAVPSGHVHSPAESYIRGNRWCGESMMTACVPLSYHGLVVATETMEFSRRRRAWLCQLVLNTFYDRARNHQLTAPCSVTNLCVCVECVGSACATTQRGIVTTKQLLCS